MGGRALHREPLDLWEVIALGKEKIFLFHYLIRGPLMKISAQEQGTSTTRKKKRRRKKLQGGLLESPNYLMSTVH